MSTSLRRPLVLLPGIVLAGAAILGGVAPHHAAPQPQHHVLGSART